MNTKMQKILFFIWIAINWLAVLYLDKSRYGVLFLLFPLPLSPVYKSCIKESCINRKKTECIFTSSVACFKH